MLFGPNWGSLSFKGAMHVQDKTIEIIKPGIFTNMNAYWAMHYCSIIETLYEQKTMGHGFQQSYMTNVPHTLENLVSKAGFSFFSNIKGSIRNFGLQSLLCHYLTSVEGAPVFFHIIEKLADQHNFDFSTDLYDYGVFVSCKDFASGTRFIEEHDPVLLGYAPLTHSQAASSVSYADLCFLIKMEDENLALLGEVEGNKGNDLRLKSFWSRKKGEYYSFGIGVQQRKKDIGSMMEPVNITGEWVNTECGWKYVVLFQSDFYLIDDFCAAIDTIQVFFTMGPAQRSNFDPSLLPVLNLIKQNWTNDVIGLLETLRELLVSDQSARLGTNPLPARVVPNLAI